VEGGEGRTEEPTPAAGEKEVPDQESTDAPTAGEAEVDLVDVDDRTELHRQHLQEVQRILCGRCVRTTTGLALRTSFISPENSPYDAETPSLL